MASSTWAGDGSYTTGSRRKKAYEWLKAANELGQTYTSRWTGQGTSNQEDYYHTPSAYPDVEIARSGDEEMVLFPSYARTLTPKKKDASLRPHRDSWTETIDDYRGTSEGDNLRSRRDESELENAVVDVDVRGWIYAPNRGPMTRKHRLMIKLARTLSGVPTPSGVASDESSDKVSGKGEDEDVDKQMRTLVDTAEQDADQAWKSSNTDRSRVESGHPATMTKDQVSMANAHLMERLRHFLTNPMAGMPVTVFFFDDEQSESRNMMTDESGHFNIRAPLTFVPTHIRVLASEDLSAAKAIEIIEPVGISLISDIDDTVKHSAIASGAKEMFRNTFVRELAELKVGGVDEWYTQVANKGVKIHYVSNAPWQLYPLLERYFKLAGLPPGSFHLKQYSGMLQGIFEPTAERKRGNLEQILRDFPERKFILVGDSGEADLEVYTDIALANRGRILGIFIRDVTTPEKKPFFENSVGHLEKPDARSRSTPQLVASDSPPSRPSLPPRRPVPTPPEREVKSVPVGDLIDLEDEDTMETAKPSPPVKPRMPPTKPSKPSSLRTDTRQSPQEAIRRKAVPPLPPRGASTARIDSHVDLDPSPSISRTQTEPLLEDKPLISAQSSRSRVPPPPPPPRRSNTASSAASSTSSTPAPRAAPAVPGNKPSYPVSAAQNALSYATERLNLSPSPSAGLRQSASNQSLPRQSTNGYNSYSGSDSMPPTPLPNKREELWRRRWERASDILESHGVVLGSWRVGGDAQPVCMWLIEEALKEIKANGAGRRS